MLSTETTLFPEEPIGALFSLSLRDRDKGILRDEPILSYLHLYFSPKFQFKSAKSFQNRRCTRRDMNPQGFAIRFHSRGRIDLKEKTLVKEKKKETRA